MKIQKNISLSLCVLFFNSVAFGSVSASANIPQTIEITKAVKTHHYKLENGLEVFLTKNINAPNVIVSHWVKAGSLQEKKGVTGIAHLFEHMMFRPLSEGKPSFFDIVSKMGGQLNASTRFESTYYYSVVPSDKLGDLLAAEADRFKNLKVSDELLNVERKAVWSEYSTKFDSSPVIESWFNIYNKGFPGHPFEWMIIGYREDLEKIKASDCKEFFGKYYRPNNTGLFITGNFDEKKTIEAISKHYGNWEKGEIQKTPTNYSETTKLTVVEGKLDAQAKIALAGFRVPMADASNAEILTLANFVLFGAKNSLLKKILVNQQHLASDVEDFNFSYDNGMLKASIITLPTAKLAEIQKSILSLPTVFDGISEEQFNSYKLNLYISFNEGVEKNHDLADMSSMMWGKYGDIKLMKKFTDKPLNISKRVMSEFINKYIQNDNMVIAINKGLAR